MTQDEIIELARQSGFLINELHCSPPILSFVGQEESMQAFTKLVAEKTTAIEQAEKQEPVATVVSENEPVTMSWWHEPALPVGTKLYTAPQPQREWVGLTDEDIDEWTPEIHVVIKAIEAKLKEKNGY